MSLALSGCMSDSERTSGRVRDDHRISGKVKSALNSSPVYKFPNVGVITYNGVVQLNGFVHKDEQKQEATELARRVPGVVEVINHVSLATAEMGSPGVVRETSWTTSSTNVTVHDPAMVAPPPRTP